MSIRRVSYRRSPWSARPVPGVLVFVRRFQMSVPRVRRPAFRAPGRPVGQQACLLARMSDRLVSHPCRVKATSVFAIRHFVRLLHSCTLALRWRTGSAKFVIRVSNGPRRPGRTPTITTSPDDPNGPLTDTLGPRQPRRSQQTPTIPTEADGFRRSRQTLTDRDGPGRPQRTATDPDDSDGPRRALSIPGPRRTLTDPARRS